MARTAVDLELVGEGAEQIGQALDLEWHRRFLFDRPAKMVPDLRQRVAELARARGLSVSLRTLPMRVSHRRRVELALTQCPTTAQMSFHGAWAGVLGRLPERPLRVVAEPMPEGRWSGRLCRVTLELREGVAASVERFGCTIVDHARLLFIDADAAAAWTSDTSLDGRADIVFHGRDAAALAHAIGASPLDDHSFGFRDLTEHDAEATLLWLDRFLRERGGTVVIDHRPHSHLHQLMAQVRASPNECGVVELAGSRACGFMTSWGDGFFPLHRELSESGAVLRVHVELGTEQQIEILERITR
ncbi:MAG: hypothetical protein JNL79_03140 [Myxococcales bacterium]|nr:hypothetical protein [Myxococcales bacterium]